jgi:tight adherence protein B
MPGLIILLFLGFFGVMMLAFGIGFKVIESQQRQHVARVLKTVSSSTMTVEVRTGPTLELASESGATSPLAERFELLRKLDMLIRGAALEWRVEPVLCGMLVLALVGAFLGYRFNVLMYEAISCSVAALVLGFSPVWYMLHKRSVRLDSFERQFPEALDFLARSVRAGHALTISMELLANDAEAPLGVEFRRLSNELNLGTSFDVGLRNLVQRVPLVDVRFFVSAVMLQRETGGNLTEILSNLAKLIRDRFRLKGHVKAISSQGRMTAAVLQAMPVCMVVALTILSPDYLPEMARDPLGRKMIFGAIIGQVLGYIALKRIVNIKI